jgi:hypothetical protein
MNSNEPKFDLVVLGTEAKGRELEELAKKLASVLKITNEQAKQVLETSDGKTIIKAISLEIIVPIRDAILAMGIKANVVPTKLNAKSELVQIEKHKVSCPACEHVHVLDEKMQLEVCDNCGIVISKYERIRKEKEEKERQRALLLAEHQSKIEAERVKREAEEAERKRRQFAEEIYRNLGLPKFINNQRKLINAVMAVHVVGIVIGISVMLVYDMFKKPSIMSTPITKEMMNQNLGIAGQVLINNMLANFDQLNANATFATETVTNETYTAIEFLDAKLIELKTNAEWDQHLLIKIDALLLQNDIDNAIQLLNKLNRVTLRFDRGGRLIGQLWNRNQIIIAKKLYNELTTAAERLTGGPLTRIKALCIIGHHFNAVGQTTEAKTVLKKAREFESAIVESMERVEASSNIAALMAVLGQKEDAQFLFSTAISILEQQDPVQKLLGIANIASSYAKAGYKHSALNLLENAIGKGSSITNLTVRTQILQRLAKVSSELSDMQMALMAIKTINSEILRDQVLYDIIIEEILANRLAQAIDLTSLITTPTYQALTFGFLGLNQQRQEIYRGLVAEFLFKAKQAANVISVKAEKAAVISELGRFLARSGDESSSSAYFVESKQLIQALVERTERDYALAILAINKAQVSRFNEAQAEVAEIHDEDLRRIVTTDIKVWQ